MRLAKVKSRVLAKALDSKKFWCLGMYVGDFKREGDCFICEVVTCEGKPTLDIKLALFDYGFNEYQEMLKVYEMAEAIIGKKEIDLHMLQPKPYQVKLNMVLALQLPQNNIDYPHYHLSY